MPSFAVCAQLLSGTCCVALLRHATKATNCCMLACWSVMSKLLAVEAPERTGIVNIHRHLQVSSCNKLWQCGRIKSDYCGVRALFFPSLVAKIDLKLITPWGLSSCNSMSSSIWAKSYDLITPLQVFKDLCGETDTPKSKIVLRQRRLSDCCFFFTSTSITPDRNFLSLYGACACFKRFVQHKRWKCRNLQILVIWFDN